MFRQCKKDDSDAVEAIYHCMGEHSMAFINQTADSLRKYSNSFI